MENITQFLPIILMFVVVYFLMIRPQQKKAKSEKEFESTLKVGDKVITKSGIHGKVSDINDTTVVLETMAGKLLFERNAISLDLTMALKNRKEVKA